MKQYRIAASELSRLITTAAAEAKRDGQEIAGLLVDNGHRIELLPCTNKSRRAGAFAFVAREIRAKVRASEMLGHKVVGAFHSHPISLAEPSASDVKYARDDSLMLLIDCIAKTARLWRIRRGAARELPLFLLPG